MFLALGAASSAIDALQALTSSKSSTSSTGVKQKAKSPFDLLSTNAQASVSAGSGTGSGAAQISPQTMSALLDAQSQSASSSTSSASKSRASALKDLFAQIDGNGDGKITKTEFEGALGAGGTNLANADSVFGKLDKDGDGSVTLNELASALKGEGPPPPSAENAGAIRRIRSDLAGPAGRVHHVRHEQRRFGDDVADLCRRFQGDDDVGRGRNLASSAASSYNFIEQMIQRQAQAIHRPPRRFAFGERLNTRPGEIASDAT